MFDFELLEAVEVRPRSASQSSASAPELGGSEAASPAARGLDEARWRHVVVEPTQQVMATWSRSSAVREIIQYFVIEDIVGTTEMIQFRDVYRILEELKVSRAGLVAKFAEVPQGEPDVERLADQILARFAGVGVPRKPGAMCFHDLFRMFEIIGITKRRLLASFVGAADFEQEQQQAPAGPRLGTYVLKREIGSGFHGPCCYLAEHANTRVQVAVKWPLPPGELTTLRDIHKVAVSCPGLPQLYASGVYDGAAYIVTDLLGSPLSRIFERLQDHPLEARWKALQVIGRLLVRRLEAVHRCGYVHCDLSPENVLLGRSRLTGSPSRSAVTPYLIDFGLARRYPNGPPLDGAKGSSEWSSIRSADGGKRLPEDDLEAVGWILANGLFGELPWFERLGHAYQYWEDHSTRGTAIFHARESKLSLLEGGWGSHSGRWRKLDDAPEELDRFLKACRGSGLIQEKAAPAEQRRPDYGHLLELLGGSAVSLDPAACMVAEEQELQCYQRDVAPLLE